MQLTTFITSGKYGPSGKYGASELEEEINAFLASGIRVSFPPKIQYDADGLWCAAIFYEQPSSPGINDDDRAQRSLTSEDVQKSERITEEYCSRIEYVALPKEVREKLEEGEKVIAAGEAALRRMQEKAGTVYISDKRRK